jgi:hypothetical protein
LWASKNPPLEKVATGDVGLIRKATPGQSIDRTSSLERSQRWWSVASSAGEGQRPRAATTQAEPTRADQTRAAGPRRGIRRTVLRLTSRGSGAHKPTVSTRLFTPAQMSRRQAAPVVDGEPLPESAGMSVPPQAAPSVSRTRTPLDHRLKAWTVIRASRPEEEPRIHPYSSPSYTADCASNHDLPKRLQAIISRSPGSFWRSGTGPPCWPSTN